MNRKSSDESQVTVLPRIYDLILWHADKLGGYPKKYKYCLGERITGIFLEAVENIIEAQYSPKKHHFLRKTNILLEKQRLLVRLSKDLNCISVREYEYMQSKINEAGRMVGGWEKFQKEREHGQEVPESL